ncbi:MAG: hypothetical protein K9N09_08805 [Candidatus Cloacimonetes bacterium]|nr:hypothetical protein [Candidatus Cloacimonadota bacterium]MCF7814435.1 hypothetical protein [Candidatus Cloacimonadota bacterium]MCF7868785.1 hypothetical protein [Candidatus Cloacimonadota bacterium]
MSRNQISQVSEIYKLHKRDGSFIYGFTVTYGNGRIKNITRKSRFEDEKAIRKIKLRRQEFNQKMEEK